MPYPTPGARRNRPTKGFRPQAVTARPSVPDKSQVIAVWSALNAFYHVPDTSTATPKEALHPGAGCGLDGLQLVSLHLNLEHRSPFDERDLLRNRLPYDHEALHFLQDRGFLEPRRKEEADMF